MMDQLKKLWQIAFGDSEEAVDAFFSTAYAPERCRYLCRENRVAAALYWLDSWYDGQKFAYIYGVATHPDFRGRGLCRELMALTHADLSRQGYAGAVLMPAKPDLRQMYAGFGYGECSTLSEITCTAASAVVVRTIDRQSYAALRREYLPSGGLIQEGENLRYLETYAQYYAGDDFLLTAVHQKNHLFGMELLGNARAASGILAAMGYASGTFRIPGKEIPFAMCLPLREDARMPSYLGLAFD